MSIKMKPVVLFTIAIIVVLGLFQFAYGETSKSLPTRGSEIILNKEEGSFPYRSNNYTMPEKASVDIVGRAISADYKLIASSDALELYMSETTLAMLVKNKKTGYVWASIPKESDLKSGQLNEEWQMAVKSPILVQYYDADDSLINGSYFSLGGKVQSVEQLPQGVRVKFVLEKIQAGLAIEIRLDGDELVVKVPQEYSWEKGTGKLASIQPYPFFGAVHKADVPGYIFIPDRSGALIRFNKAHSRIDEPYVGKIYGMDMATDSMDNFFGETPVPVFGLVHGVGNNGLLGIVESGKYYSEILAYPSGLNTDFYWVSPKFYIRYGYFQPTSKSMGGFNTYQKDPIVGDRQIRYMFLGGGHADYVGMAKTYRTYLQDKKELVRKTKPQTNIPLQINLFGAETEPGVFGANVVPMTTFDQAQTIVDRLAGLGITNLTAVYQGWNKGGLNGQKPAEFPVESKLGGKPKLKHLQQYLSGKGIPLYLMNNYTNAFANTNRLSFRTDAVRSLSNKIIEFPFFGWGNDEYFGNIKTRFINPGKAREIAESDAKTYQEIGVDGVALEWMGNILFSDYNSKHPYTREQAAEEYRKLSATLISRLKSLAVDSPNDYLWKYTDKIFGMSMGSSQYMYETDTVPFLQIVLHGSIEYYSSQSNANSSPREDMLRMIEYGAYPSYLLTYEPYWKLKDTPSTNLLTTQYEDLEKPLKEQYEMINNALKQVQAATIETRHVLDFGIVSVKYSNGVEIIVNYTSNDYPYGGLTVKAKSFAVNGGE